MHINFIFLSLQSYCHGRLKHNYKIKCFCFQSIPYSYKIKFKKAEQFYFINPIDNFIIQASRLFFGERDVAGMFATLEPLHAMLDKGPQTLKETSFVQAYGVDLAEAQKYCKQYKVSNNIRHLNQAWDLYYHVFRRISRQLPQLTQLELQYVSPKLLMCRDLELAIPGSYLPNRAICRISSFNSSLQVITSKQRPRKLCMRGSDGKEYMFLLKGHEDLRQDERVMQFFSLVNSLLTSDPETLKRNLTIQRFSVVPLSTNSGAKISSISIFDSDWLFVSFHVP